MRLAALFVYGGALEWLDSSALGKLGRSGVSLPPYSAEEAAVVNPRGTFSDATRCDSG